ncbi:unnamed protein product, partial [Brenthis ino]
MLWSGLPLLFRLEKNNQMRPNSNIFLVPIMVFNYPFPSPTTSARYKFSACRDGDRDYTEIHLYKLYAGRAADRKK